MCGIAGIIDYNNDKQVNFDILKNMSDVIIHRGPDSDGQWVSQDRTCGLTFRRLAIIDLSPAGNQPMIAKEGKFSIVFNGEIYNHSEIREDLKKKGYVYHSGTDTETILFGYIEYGKEILNKLIGMWSFAIWDSEKKELFASRDRIGIKPFYYTFSNGRFIFGSEIKSILQHPSQSTDINLDEVPNYLTFGSTGFSTLFKNITKLRAGHYIHIRNNKEPEIAEYWNPLQKSSNQFQLSSDEIQKETIRLLRQAVKDRMMSDVPFGVFLSGGIDSSLNVALMAELMDRPVDTFTVGFKELEHYNELGYARKVSSLFKTNHREILIDHNDSLPILEDLVWHEDDPNADPVCIPLYFLSKLTRDSGTTVVQVGEGSDEQFCGYKWMLRDYRFYQKYWKRYNNLPTFLKKGIQHSISPLLNKPQLHLIYEYFRKAADNNHFYWSGVPIFSQSFLEKIYSDNFRNFSTLPSKHVDNVYEEMFFNEPNADILQQIEYIELKQRLSEILLMRVDKIGMAHSIEARVPFLDHRLVEFTMSIPHNLKVQNKKLTKSILKNAVGTYLPDEIINRKKQGFWAPVKEWLRHDWYSYAETNILNSKLIREKVFDKNYINTVLKKHKSGSYNFSTQIFSLLMLSLWEKKFLKNSITEF